MDVDDNDDDDDDDDDDDKALRPNDKSIYFFNIVLYVPCIMQRQFIKPSLHALKYEYNRHTIFYMFRHFLSAIVRECLYFIFLL